MQHFSVALFYYKVLVTGFWFAEASSFPSNGSRCAASATYQVAPVRGDSLLESFCQQHSMCSFRCLSNRLLHRLLPSSRSNAFLLLCSLCLTHRPLYDMHSEGETAGETEHSDGDRENFFFFLFGNLLCVRLRLGGHGWGDDSELGLGVVHRKNGC